MALQLRRPSVRILVTASLLITATTCFVSAQTAADCYKSEFLSDSAVPKLDLTNFGYNSRSVLLTPTTPTNKETWTGETNTTSSTLNAASIQAIKPISGSVGLAQPAATPVSGRGGGTHPSANPPTDPTWTPTSGMWSSAVNWNPNTVPNMAGAMAGYSTNANSTATVDQSNFTIATLSLSGTNNNSWAIAFSSSTNSLTFDNSGGGATVSNNDTASGSPKSNQLVIGTTGTRGVLTLADNLTVSNTSTNQSAAGNGSIQINSVIGGNGSITFSNVSNDPNSGAIILTGSNTFTGSSTIAKGVVATNSSTSFSTGQVNLGSSGGGSASLVTTSGNILANNITVVASGGTLLLGSTSSSNVGFSGTITLNSDLSLTSSSTTGTNTLTLSNVVSGLGALTKIGLGDATLSGTTSNTYSGKTTVSNGVLILNKTAGLNAISSTGASGSSAANTDLQINTGGTVKLTNSNQIINSAKIALSGGIMTLNGVSEGTSLANGAGVGALTLSANSVIDLAGTSVLHFAASSGQIWNGTLSIYDYSGTPVTGNGAEELLFGSDGSGLTQTQLSMIAFYSGAGTGFLGTAAFAPDMDGEIVPVPESSTWVAGGLTLLAICFSQRRRFVQG